MLDVVGSAVLTVCLAVVVAMVVFDPLAKRKPGRHRPETVVPVGDMWLITYPALYQRYAYFVGLYGHGVWQAQEWAQRTQRRAELEARRRARQALADYRWLAQYEQTWPTIGELVGAS